MPKYAPNKMPPSVKRRYFELIRHGRRGAAASIYQTAIDELARRAGTAA